MLSTFWSICPHFFNTKNIEQCQFIIFANKRMIREKTFLQYELSSIIFYIHQFFQAIQAWYSCLFVCNSKSKAISQVKAYIFYDLYDVYQTQLGLEVLILIGPYGTGSPEPTRPQSGLEVLNLPDTVGLVGTEYARSLWA